MGNLKLRGNINSGYYNRTLNRYITKNRNLKTQIISMIMEDNHSPIRELSLTEPGELIKLLNRPENYLPEVKRAYTIILNKYNWNQKRAARALGIPRSTFRDQMAKYQVKKPDST